MLGSIYFTRDKVVDFPKSGHIFFFENSQEKVARLLLSYSTVVLYIGISKVWGFLPKNPTD